MASTIRYRPRSRGMKELLTSQGVQDDLLRRAEKVADRVRATGAPGVFSGGEGGIIADSYKGTNRAGATVIGVPLAYEEAHRPLGASIDAAR